MPSSSAKQNRTMRAAMHDPTFAKRMGIPQSVATDFVRADQAAGNGFKKNTPSSTPSKPPQFAGRGASRIAAARKAKKARIKSKSVAASKARFAARGM